MNTHTEPLTHECARHAESLAAVVDDMLNGRDRAALDDHVATCAPCRRLLADLRQIKAVARTLEPLEPPPRVWHALRQQVVGEARLPRDDAMWWRWAFAGTTLVGAVIVWLMVPLLDRPAPEGVPVPRGGAATSRDLEADLVQRPYTETIRELERLATVEGGRGGPARDAVTRALALIDAAIVESRSAVSTDPDNAVARSRLRAGLRHKVTLLQAAVRVQEQSAFWNDRPSHEE